MVVLEAVVQKDIHQVVRVEQVILLVNRLLVEMVRLL